MDTEQQIANDAAPDTRRDSDDADPEQVESSMYADQGTGRREDCDTDVSEEVEKHRTSMSCD